MSTHNKSYLTFLFKNVWSGDNWQNVELLSKMRYEDMLPQALWFVKTVDRFSTFLISILKGHIDITQES